MHAVPAALATIEKLAKDYVGKVKVGKLDTDANRDVALKYQISAIPTVILFKDGQVGQKVRRASPGARLQGSLRFGHGEGVGPLAIK